LKAVDAQISFQKIIIFASHAHWEKSLMNPNESVSQLRYAMDTKLLEIVVIATNAQPVTHQRSLIMIEMHAISKDLIAIVTKDTQKMVTRVFHASMVLNHSIGISYMNM